MPAIDNLMAALGRAMPPPRPCDRLPVPGVATGLQEGRTAVYIPPGATPAEAAAIIAEICPVRPAKAVRRKRDLPPPPPRPEVPVVVLNGDGRPVMRVPLTGEIGTGRHFIVDLLTFDRMKLFAGQDWTLVQPGGPGATAYVASRRRQAQRAAEDVDGAGRYVRLARWIKRAPKGSVVTYADGDALNLTDRNLVLVDRKEFWDHHRLNGHLTMDEHLAE